MITKQQAATLYAYDYKLQQNEPSLEPKILTITGVGNGWITVKRGIDANFTVYLKDIGTDYKILCRPLSDLTKEIKCIGVPIVELANTYQKSNWQVNDNYQSCISEDYRLEFRYTDGVFCVQDYARYNLLMNQEALFAWLDKHHFIRGVSEDCLIYITD